MGRSRSDPEARNRYILENQIVNFEEPKDIRFINRSGEHHGRLEVLYYVGQDKRHTSYYMCRCECGAEVIVNITTVRSGIVNSCGCIQREFTSDKNKTHGLSSSKIYTVWSAMKNRCYNQNDKRYNHYGGRGITICDEWLDKENGFINFYNWAIENGYSDTLTIDRIDVDGNYEPSNCRWATQYEQSNNKQVSNYITYKGYTFTAEIWSRITKISPGQIRYRNNHGWTPEDTLRTPIGNKRGQGFLCWEVDPDFLKYNKN